MADFTNKTFEETYRDFWKEEDGYHRVLFNSGRALQARELIESQTIIQEEIARFGRNIFKEGALVNPGGATVDNRLEYIRLDPVSILSPDLLGKTLTNNTLVDKGIEVKVVEIVEATATDPATLYVQYMDTSVVTNNSVAPRISALDTLIALDGSVTSSITVAADGAIPAAGRGTKAYFAAGDFFVQGHFVYMEGGSSFIDKYSSLPTVDVGFRIVQTIITEGEDDSLYDNQGEVPNATAPGAHRYQIKLIPTTRDQVEEEENFVFIARVVDGVITREVSTFDAYNRINDLLAQRTKEESGDYVVEPFKAIFEELDDANLNLDVTEGIAYVDGYRLEIGTTDITVPKARDTLDKTNENVEARFGNYVYIDADNCEGIGRLNTFSYVRIKNATNDVIGYANVRMIEQDPTGYRAYLFNIIMSGIFDQTGRIGTENFSDAVELDDPLSGDVMPLVSSDLYATADNNLLFPLPSKSPTKDVITANYTAQVYHEATANSNGEITIAGTEYTNWVIAEDAGPILPITPTAGTYSGLTPSGSYKILSFEEITSAPRKKTITAATVIQGIPAVDNQKRPIILNVADAIAIQSVEHRLLATDPWVDITHQFTLDGGQRDNFYDLAQVLVKPGYTIPFGAQSEVKVEFTYYVHENIGQYFAASSYDLDDYDEIPSHTTASGEVISLRDVLDFRPVKQSAPSYTNEFEIFPLPQNSSAITISNISYYLPRIDILVANAVDSRGDIGFGELQVIQGEPAENPREPEVPTGSLALYKFKLNAYTFGTADLSSTYVPNKRFTMKDIGKLSERVEDLYELTTLSLLESNTNSLNVLDSNGLSRTKAGFIADNFTDFTFSDINNPDYRASIDPNGRLKPSFRENSVRMVYSTDNTTSVTKKGDLVTLPYTDVSLVSQLLATSTMNVNPFAVITQTGHMNLSPSSDEWVETRNLPPIMQTTVRRFDETRVEDFDTRPALRSGRLSNNASNSGLFTTIPRDVSFRAASRSIQDFIGERVADVEIIPFMRSRRINFTVKGLRPNTKMFAFFGGVDVSAWVRQEVAATNFSDDTQEFGSQYANATGYPAVLGGATLLETDSKGGLIGTFFLPNTTAINFRTGTQEFKLLDVDVDDESEALCSTRATYTSTGTIESVQRTVRSTRVVGRRAGRRDPLAQTFFVDQIENPNGMFLTKARVFVETADANIPLQVQIRSVENGIPTNIILPGAVKFIDPADITIATNPETIEDVQAAATIVEFDEPIYLTSGEEYAIILLAESVEYNVYIAETYKNVFGSREDRVTKQPTLGSLFLSQNGFTWTPDQTKDLMFELDRAEFSTTGTLLLDNAPLPKVTLGTDPFETTSGSSLVSVNHEGHGFTSGDTVSISDVTNGTGGLIASDLEGLFQVVNPTWEGYTIDVTTLASGSSVGGGNDVTASQQVMFDQFVPLIQTITPNTTSVVAQGSTAEGSSYGSGRSSAAANNLYTTTGNQLVFLNDINLNTTPKVVSTEDNAGTSPNLSLSITLATQDSKVSPVIDLQRTSVLALENVIGIDDSAQHITIPTVIDEPSVGLKIIFAANRPSTSEFEVYIKTATDEDSLDQVDSEGDSVIEWVLAPIDTIIPSDEDSEVFRDYEYSLDIDLFSVFQVKIVMKSTNSSKSPIIRDLRAIALVA
jgi:hypothetical protein